MRPRTLRAGEVAGEGVPVRILVACMGNLLRGDDGFGVAVAQALESADLPEGTHVAETGISGTAMAHEMMEGYDAMVIVDAVDRDGEPGTLYVEEAQVPEIGAYSKREISSFTADMHQTDPAKVLILGQALGVLPERVFIVGCQPAELDDLEDTLSSPVEACLPRAVEAIEALTGRLVDQAA